jgi:transcriptional regulator with XRE-family HTH domain
VPLRRVTHHVSRLSDRETAICRRLKSVREKLGIDQSKVAKRLGVKREFISSLEKIRAPLRFDIGLRFCREFVVSEEWLATGEFHALNIEAAKRLPGSHGATLDEIFIRHCFDLWSEPLTRTIPPRTLFSAAFDNFLAPINAQLAGQNFYGPRLIPNEHDGVEIARSILEAHLDGRLLLLKNEAGKYAKDERVVQRVFLRAVFEVTEILWKRFMGMPTPEIGALHFRYLRDLTKFVDAPIGPLFADDPSANAAPMTVQRKQK